MKIIEFGKDDSEDRVGRMKILEFDGGRHLEHEHPKTGAGPAAVSGWKPAHVHRSGNSLKMHVLDLGKLRTDKNFMVANSTVATARNPNPSGQVIDIPVSAYFIEHSDGNVLFDTGCSPDWERRWPQGTKEVFPVIGGEECMLPARLEALGVGPDQIRYVVLSHLHCDHAGCVDYFRKSQIVVHEDEFAGAYTHFALRDDSTPYIVNDLENWSRLDLNWRRVGRQEADQTLVEGVRLLNFGGGHAYGMLGVEVALRSRDSVLLVADACYTAENFGPPMRPPGISHDSIGYARTIERIRSLASSRKASVWYGHDAAQFDTLRKSTEGWYE